MSVKNQLELSEDQIFKPCVKCGLSTNLQLYSIYTYPPRDNMIVENRAYHKECASAEALKYGLASWSFIGQTAKFCSVTKSKDRSKGTFKVWHVKR